MEEDEEEDIKPKKRGRPAKPAEDVIESSPVAPSGNTPTKEPAAAAAKKRARSASAEPTEEEKAKSEAEADEPVTKRGRKSSTTATTKTKAEKPVKEAASKKEKETKPPAKKAKDTEAVTTAVKKMTVEEPKDEPESEVSEAEDSDAEKPAINAKARKEVQQKLTSTKHPYPDWKAGEPVPYAALAKTFTLIEATTKRLEKLSHTSLFLRQVLRLTPDELLLVIHLMINRLAADYEGVELGIGESLLMKAICESCGRSMIKLKEDHRQIGDLGEVAMKSRNTQQTLFKPKPLTVKSVHAGLKEIATTVGTGGQTKKVAGIKKLLSAAQGDEAKYLVRGLEGKLRLGLAEKTVIVGLSQAVCVHEAEKAGKKTPSLEAMQAAESMLKEVYSELPNYEIIIPEMMKGGIMKLKDACKLQPGVPLKPMLAKPTKAITEVLDRFEGKRFTCEYKYDGERVQIHYVAPDSSIAFPTIDPKKGIAKIFSRNSEELSPKYPDILAALDKWVKPGIESFVLDCEAVAWDREEKRVLPFQQLMTRKKKDVTVEEVKIKVCVFGFDLLFLNGKSMVQETLSVRRDAMHTSFEEVPGEFGFATSTDGQELDTIQTFLDESIKASCEGLMVKMLDTSESYYEPSKRSRNWLKVKKDYLAGAGDSLDLVVIGGYHGKGKRTSVYGAFMLACYNPNSQNFESICNIGTGFSEEMLQKLHAQLVEFEIEKPKPYYMHASGNMQQPDVWFEPKVVWEVKTADLSLSPKYMAAKGMADTEGKGRGISLRFPRFIRERDDKKAEDATSSNQVAEMYKKQDVVMNNMKKGGVDDDFEY
jgi:DNA ligase-1